MTSLPVRRAFAAGLGAAALTATLIAGAAPASAKPKPQPTAPVPLQLLALNDFHGQLEPPTGSSSRLPGFPTTRENTTTGNTTGFGGVEYFASQLRALEATADDANTLTVAAGDLIGASPLLSAAFHDEPTIDALNRIGLDYASVGNHEFDEGPEELLRIQNGGCHPDDGCADPDLPYQGADFQYLSANAFVDATGESLLPEVAIRKVQGIKVGFIGMTLEGTPSVVTPSGVAGLSFGDEAETANRHARNLQRAGAEAIVVLLHEGGAQNGSGTTVDSCGGTLSAQQVAEGQVPFAGNITEIVPRLDDAIDVVVTGHTHQAYNCRYVDGVGFIPSSAETADRGMLITSAASVGRVVTDIDLTLDPVTGDVLTSTADNVPVEKSAGADAEMTELISYWRNLLGPIAGEVVGHAGEGLVSRGDSIEKITYRRTATSNSTVNGELPLGNFIADGQLAATPTSVAAFMNPGGVRADLGAGPVTYEEAFSVQPFGNFLSQITVTDEVLQCVLEQQFAVGTILQPAGITYQVSSAGIAGTTADPCSGTVVPDSSVVINGTPITEDGIAEYRITVNNFLADGGDGFTQLRRGTARQDVTSPEDDLAALIQYLAPTTPEQPATAPTTDRITGTN
jgi:5'-nucleotidase